MKISENCIHCGKCTEVCPFLGKYNIDLSGFEEREDLKYHCFLCRKCFYSCPVGIDGSKIALKMRRNETGDKKLKEKGYGLMVLEKDNYKFRSWSKKPSGLKENKKILRTKIVGTKNEINEMGNSLIFPGCNFMSFFPKTTDRLQKIAEDNGYFIAGDCCSKPLYEVGLTEKARKNTDKLKENLKKRNISEIICVCPNCFYFFRTMGLQKEFSIVMIYDKLSGLKDSQSEDGMLHINKDTEIKTMYLPCPDYKSHEILSEVLRLTGENPEIINDVICCGAGGGAFMKDKDVTEGLSESMGKYSDVFTYCATCTGTFKRQGVSVNHVLPYLLGSPEEPDTEKSLINRMVRRF